MPNQYQWYTLKKGDKFKHSSRRRMDITVNDVQKVLGLYLFNFPDMQDLDFVINQILNIKERTIGAYPELSTDKWHDGKGEAFLEKINAAIDNIEDMNVLDALKNWLGDKHEIPTTSQHQEKSFIDNLYLDKGNKIWKVREITTESNHDDFKQSLIYGQTDTRKLQENFEDAILEKDDFDDIVNDSDIKVTEEKGGVGETSDYQFLEFNLSFGFDLNSSIHAKKLKNIFKNQKIVFVPDAATITSLGKPSGKIGLVDTYETQFVEDDPKQKDKPHFDPSRAKPVTFTDKATGKTRLTTTAGEWIGASSELKESEVSGIKGQKRKKVKTSGKYEPPKEGEEDDLEEHREALEASRERWEEAHRLDTFNADDIFEDSSPENIKKWVIALWDNKNNTLWDYMKNSSMPLNLTKVGNYIISFRIKRDLKGRDDDKIVLKWTFKQKKILSKELLMNPAGGGGLYAQKFNLGSGHPETTRLIGPGLDADKAELETQGFNRYRDFLANFVTSRFNTLENAVRNSDANEGGEE